MPLTLVNMSILMKKIREGFQDQRLVQFADEVVRRSKKLPIVRDLYVTDIGHYPHSRHHRVDRPEGSPNHSLIYCAAGSGWASWPGMRRLAVPQDGVLILPEGLPHSYGASERAPWKIYWVHFNGRRSEEFVALLRGDPSANLLAVPEADFIADAFEDTYRGLDEGLTDAGLLMMSTGLGRMLGLIHRYRRAPGRKARHAEERIARSMHWMRDRLGEPLQLADLARAASLSVPHYCALFKKQVGRSPMRYLAQLRLQRACELLDRDERTVAEIAAEVGYANPFHFSRNFSAYMGLSPRAYRLAVKG